MQISFTILWPAMQAIDMKSCGLKWLFSKDFEDPGYFNFLGWSFWMSECHSRQDILVFLFFFLTGSITLYPDLYISSQTDYQRRSCTSESY